MKKVFLLIGALSVSYYCFNKELLDLKYERFKCQKELKNVYSYSRMLEKNQRHGQVVTREKWDLIHVKKSETLQKLNLLNAKIEDMGKL